MTSEISISSNESSVPGVGGLPTHGNSESSVLPITGHKLNGLNYLQWSQSVFMFISGKGKEDYLTGTIETPSKDDPSYKKWNSENHMVMSWLINTMNLEIGQNFKFYETAKEIWENFKETYSDNENTSKLFEIKGILHNLQQGDASVTQYYNLLTRYWQQLDMLENITWDCQLDKKKYDKIVEEERIFKLLLGLNKDLDEVRGRILGTKPLPTLCEAFSEVRREESRKKIMMGRPGILISGESFALAAYGTNNKGSDNQPHKGRPWCDHCRRPGHIKDKCWKIHGKPTDWKPRKPQSENRGYVATTEEKPISEDAVFSKEQLDFFRTCSIKLKSIHQLSACSNNYKVRITDGSLSTDQDSEKMIGNAKECAGLYLLKDGNLGENSATSKDQYQFWHLYNESTDSFPLISHINPENNTESISQEEKSPPNFHVQNTGEWKNLVYSRKPRDNEVKHPILPKPYQDPNPSTVPTESGDDYEEMNKLKTILAKEFEIKDLGKLNYFLGMEVAGSNKGIYISQRKSTLDLPKETGMLGCKPVDTPMDPTCKLGTKEGSTPVDKGRYQCLVGRLIYLSHTRPNIAFSVSVVSQFMNNPTEEHLDAVYRILRYLRMTPGKGLFFKKGYRKNIDIYCDADWAGSITDRRSTSGYCTYVWGNLVTWRSKKQSVVSRSSAEAEFRAIALSICEGMWLKRLLEELKITCEGSIKVFCDNQASINIAKNPVHHDRTKHVEIDRHFIREKIEGGIIQMVYIPSSHQTADILTKALPKVNFDNLNSKLGMINIYSLLEGE
ncbi:hypothetical protein RJ639_010652 [Escallonia herrerae]|uniref:Retrovirus-related Pol polyprotein from transposon RE1 n=1 Tax=Escallonia herrerae TaxID=1293975 RepID=A0AA89AUP2_9ASTE|nr:hypothetical protein RJ639_010652 [Escallonia herrerae]